MAASSNPGREDKDAGNAHFKNGEFLKAAASYTKAIKADPSNHVYYSNRAQAFLRLNKVTRALEDADKCIELSPDFVKGYHRKALALAALDRKEEAAELALVACEMDPTSRELVQLGVSIKGRGFVNEVAERRKAKKAEAGEEHGQAAAGDGANCAPAVPKPASPALPQSGAAKGAPTKALADLDSEEFATEIVRLTLGDLLKDKTIEGRVYTQPPQPHSKTRDKKKKKGKGTGDDAPLGIMQISKAFESPETLAQCIPAVRTHVQQFGAQAAVIAVLKSKVACPQVWLGKGASWKFDEGCEGIFMQLEHPKGRAMWFTHIEDRETLKVGETVQLDPEAFALLPKLFQ